MVAIAVSAPLVPPCPRLLPGVALCGAVGLVALALQRAELMLFGRAWLEGLVLAIVLGTGVRTLWEPGAVWDAGISFSAKMLLEVAVVLLGASLSFPVVLAAGPVLLGGIVIVVVLAIGGSYLIGRLMGLPPRMATLVACGNSICGNSAIAAVAPVIGADGKDVAAAIGFTALLGVVLVLLLPVLGTLLRLSVLQYGALAGLTVYAVPQVLAAAAPMGAVAVQFGTLIKLVRVLMLGPVVLGLSLTVGGRTRPALWRMVPWFILGFLGLATLRSAGLVPTVALPPMAEAATLLTLIAMAALGLSTDLRLVAQAGLRVSLTAGLSLLALATLALALIHLAGV